MTNHSPTQGAAGRRLNRCFLLPIVSLVGLVLGVHAAVAAGANDSACRVQSGSLQATISSDGKITGLQIGKESLSVTAETIVEGCRTEGSVECRSTADGGWEFRRKLIHGSNGPMGQVATQRCELIERVRPGADSIRWELEIRGGDDEPWSTPITTRLKCPVTPGSRFWTPWVVGNNQQFADVTNAVRTSGTGNPLAPRPMTSACWGYGQGTTMPMASVLDEKTDQGISLILSPEDALLDVTLWSAADGAITFQRLNHRLGQGRNTRFAMDIVVHEADWRGGLRWMTQRYAPYFDPPNPKVAEMAGCGAYSGWDGPVDVERMKRMSFRILWDAAFAWPFFGMFMPPVDHWRTWSSEETSYDQMNERGRKLREAGFVPLNYFILSEFGTEIFGKQPPTNTFAADEEWKDQFGLLRKRFADSIVLDANGREGSTWCGDIIMDPAGASYQAHICEQARRYMEKMPDWAGLACDRLFFPSYGTVNYAADDGVGWYGGRTGRHYSISFKRGMTSIAAIVHRAGKVILYNPFVAHRLDYYRDVDGFFSEGTIDAALLGMHKPVVVWTGSTNDLNPDPDAFFQRHLYLGAYPMVPYPGKTHGITPNPWAEKYYLDYGPLLSAMRGKQWVLEPHCVEVADGGAQANLFAVPGGYAVPVMFAGQAQSVEVVLRGLQGLSRRTRVDAVHPGVESPVKVDVRRRKGAVVLTVPLRRGCAMVRIMNEGAKAHD